MSFEGERDFGGFENPPNFQASMKEFKKARLWLEGRARKLEEMITSGRNDPSEINMGLQVFEECYDKAMEAHSDLMDHPSVTLEEVTQGVNEMLIFVQHKEEIKVRAVQLLKVLEKESEETQQSENVSEEGNRNNQIIQAPPSAVQPHEMGENRGVPIVTSPSDGVSDVLAGGTDTVGQLAIAGQQPVQGVQSHSTEFLKLEKIPWPTTDGSPHTFLGFRYFVDSNIAPNTRFGSHYQLTMLKVHVTGPAKLFLEFANCIPRINVMASNNFTK